MVKRWSEVSAIAGVGEHRLGPPLESATGQPLLYHRKIDAHNGISGLTGVARGALWTILALASFFAADTLLFRLGWYDRFLEPDSSAGSLEAQMHWLESTPAAKVPEVLVVGDSRIAEGFSAPLADSVTSQRLHFWNFGIPGTTPRVWYYALRDADPTRRRFSAIVIAMDNYSDADWPDSAEDRVADQNYLVMRLGLSDCIDFVSSISSTDLQHRALFQCLLRGVTLREDVQNFLTHPRSRFVRTADSRKRGLFYINTYPGKEENLHGLSVDWARRTIRFPDGATPAVRRKVTDLLFREAAPDPGALGHYRRFWLGGILDFYKDSPTRFVFVQMPRGPLVNPNVVADTRQRRFIDAASRRPRVDVLPTDTFDDLQRPELFADAQHLNRDGRPIFSTRLAQRVDAILAGAAR